MITKRSSNEIQRGHDISTRGLDILCIAAELDEIESSDMLSGFIQTPWKIKPFPNSGIQVRTRVTVKQSNIGNNLTYKIKISSETASIGTNREESFQETMRILKKYETLISEFQSRLGKI